VQKVWAREAREGLWFVRLRAIWLYPLAGSSVRNKTLLVTEIRMRAKRCSYLYDNGCWT